MKIAYFINSMEGGGAQTPLPKIVRALERAGAKVTVYALARRDGLAIPKLEAAGVDLIVREGGGGDHLAALAWMREQIRQTGADLVWTSLTRATLLGQVAGRREGRPVVSWQHNAFLKPWNERLLRWRASSADLWVADSAQVAGLTRERLRLPQEKVTTWPIFAADPDARQAKPWTPGDRLHLGTLGRLHPAKGYDFLIEALGRLKQRGILDTRSYRLTIGGRGPEEQALKARAQELGLEHVEFAGFVEDTENFLAQLHLYLQPSRREGFCIAAHEAMQAGIAPIVSRTGEMPYTVNAPELGYAIEVGDIEGLSDALAECFRDPGALHAKGQAVRARVLDRFSQAVFDTTASDILERVRPLIGKR